MATQQTATTQYVEAKNGVRFAYRRLGRSVGVPLVMTIHFRANMDFWDPALINELAAARPVVTFDQAGVGRSTGEIPETFQGWADDAIAFVKALGLTQIDLLGFSMAGAAAQMVALTAPQLVRKLILAGTTSSQPTSSPAPGIFWLREVAQGDFFKVLAAAVTPDEIKHALAYSFFYMDDRGRAAADAYWNRISERSINGEPRKIELVDPDSGAKRQAAAMVHWNTPNPRNSFDRLGELKMPVLVVNGDNDVLIPTSRSWEMASRIATAQLIIYLQAGHGFLYQYAGLVAKHINTFLDGDEYGDIRSRLYKVRCTRLFMMRVGDYHRQEGTSRP
ncbi:hypothetical protein MMC20_002837 [Loxospora ochrophaea]|nr:hypothetical protein [Loxospora ochrophaea]